MYEGREVVHPIRKVDTNVYGRSLTDSVIGQSANRRATLLGDVILTERDIQRARDDIQTSYRGRDDSFVDKSSGRFENGRSHKRDDFDDFGGFGTGSFKSEVMDMVDKFFDDDDDFNFGFGSRNSRSNGTRYSDRNLSSKRREENPYTVRDDLSKYRGSVESVNASLARSDYAASDSGYPLTGRRRNLSDVDEFDSSFSDIASDTGHRRFSRHKPERNSYSRRNDHSEFDSRAASRAHQDDNYRYSHLSDRNTAVSADDILQRAGKSIRGNRDTNTSISDRSENTKHKRINNYNLESRNDNKYYNRKDGEYSRLGDSAFEMNDEDNTCGSVNSMPNNAFRSQSYQADDEELYTRSLPNLSESEQSSRRQQHSSADDKQHWNDRRKRIDKALTWIRSELGVLRTQDKVLMSQFQRCQDSIEELKKQRPWYEVFSDDEEEEEDGKHWEDWEIDDFDKSDVREFNRRSQSIPH
ncbi:RNA polymerase-associated protein LEO1-like [Ruditapes philippinarum]|uniref:RNA polymerase-associated protein LEO1-like n=1 Tax=Ruditapes philippinarum TaxID=129788 RepID=UPI00295BC957|nr:RNA polymerase-associated protein LEO1-like [Ruditapes philippinarum]